MIKRIRLFMVWGIVAALVITSVELAAEEKAGVEVVIKNKNNSIYVELLGNGAMYSLNYERRVSKNFLLRIGGNIALTDGKFGWELMDTDFTSILFGTMNYISPMRNPDWAFEVGIGPSVWFNGKKISIVMVTSTFGVRYQPRKGNLLVRLGITPLFNIFPWVGLSVGFSF